MPAIAAPLPQFFDLNGAPLEGGFIHIGTAGGNPETAPVAVYWDAAMTQPAAQPLRTSRGYVARSGTPAAVYAAGAYSLTAKQRDGVRVLYAPTSAEYDTAAALALSLASSAAAADGDAMLAVKKTAAGAVATTQHEMNERTVDVLDFMSDAQRTDYRTRALALDLTTPLNTATAMAKAAGMKLTAAPGSARITGTLTVDCDADLKSMMISCSASTMSGPAVRVGTTADYSFDLDIVLPFITNAAKTGTGWVGFDTKIGAEIANAYHCRVSVPSVTGFGVGLTMGGYSKGCVYNTVHLGILAQNKIQHQLLPKTGDGWCNQNLFIGGRLFFDSSEGVNTSGTKMVHLAAQAAATVGPPDSNTWINTTIEDDTPEFYLDVQGAWNRWVNVRFETSVTRGAPDVRFYSEVAGETTSNYIDGGYDTRGFDFTFAGLSSPYNARINSRTNNAIEVAECGWSIANRGGSTSANPHFQGFSAGTQPLGKTAAATDWRYRLYADGLAMKAAADAEPRVVLESGSGRIYLGPGSAAPTAYFGPGIGDQVQVNGAFFPSTDNTRTLGQPSNRWSQLHAGTATIATSDERAKQDIEDIPDAWLDAWGDVQWQRFRFKDAVAQKGDNARWHVGLIAQRVRDAFAARGLDAFALGLLCFDAWEAKAEERDGAGALFAAAVEAGDRYGIRYEEALALECAWVRRELSKK